MELNWHKRFRGGKIKKWEFVVKSSWGLHSYKTGHYTSLIGGPAVECAKIKKKKHVQSVNIYWFSFLNVQIRDLLAAYNYLLFLLFFIEKQNLLLQKQ